MNNFQPTEAELEILQIFWEHQPCTIGLVHEKIREQRKVGYTTVSKQIERMTKKGVLDRKKEGGSYLYTALPKEEEVLQDLSGKFVNRVYKGSAVKLAMHALGQNKASLEELEALQAWLNQQKEQYD